MSFIRPNTDYYPDYIDKRKLIMLWRTTIFLGSVFFVLAFWTFFYNWIVSVVYFLIFLIVSGSLAYLHFTKKYKPILYLYSIIGMVIIAVTCNLQTGVPHVPDFMWGMTLVIFIFTTLGRKAGWISLGCLAFITTFHFIYFFESVELKYKPLTSIDLFGVSTEIFMALCLCGYFISQHLSFTQYTEGQMSLANAELELQNQIIQRKSDENAILVKEIHHRVKNNLQIIISLLRMHRDEVSSPEAQKDFDEAINRILSMALLHQQMYREKELSRFNLEEYVTILVHDIVESYRSTHQEIETEIRIQNVALKLESIVPLGLLINELVSNSLKHAFSNGQRGTIQLMIKRQENGFLLTYSDDGVWVESDFMVKGFGSELVEMLSEQLNGKLTRNCSSYELLVNVDDK